MNNSFERLIDGMVATLRVEVLPRLADEFARGQVFGVINVLNNLRIRAEWAPGLLHEQVAIQRRAFAAIDALLACGSSAPSPGAPVGGDGAGVRYAEARGAEQGAAPVPSPPPLPGGEPPTFVTAAELEVLRNEGDRAICALLDWLANARAGLPAELAGGVEAELRRAMRAQNELEIRRAARPMFAEMAQGGEG